MIFFLKIGLWVDFLGYIALVEYEKQNTIVDQVMGEMLELAKNEKFKNKYPLFVEKIMLKKNKRTYNSLGLLF